MLGICGGLQMLGEALIDPHGIDGNGPGLGLLPLVTVFEPDKTVKRTQAALRRRERRLGRAVGREHAGYEIHHGRTFQHPGMAGRARRHAAAAWAGRTSRATCWACTCTACSRMPAVLHALFGATAPTLDSVFDGLADFIGRHFRPAVIADLIRDPAGAPTTWIPGQARNDTNQ